MIIALIDSNNEELEFTNSLIKKEIQKYTSNFIIEKIDTPLTLDLNKYYDVLFLEIEMLKDGIELAREYFKYHKKLKLSLSVIVLNEYLIHLMFIHFILLKKNI